MDSFKVTYHPNESWASLGDLLFVDHPVGTGWSYGTHSPTTLEDIGAEFVTFLEAFYEEFPARKSQELVLTGESFAGKYLSFTGQAILDQNRQSNADSQINFKSLILSNPLVDVETERMHQHELGYAIGLYDDGQSAQVETLRRHCEESISDPDVSTSSAETNCKNIENYISNLAGGVNQMDARYFKSDNMPNDVF
jgi:carboxypeptidase D